MRSFLMAAGMVATLGAVAPATAQEVNHLSAGVGATLEDFRARYEFPGATATIALRDGTVATATVGLADLEAALADLSIEAVR